MNGKLLKISSNDLYGNVDDRTIAVFAAFNHKKYMNKYVIFTYDGEFDKNKLYYGSLHLKKNSIVIFSVIESSKQYVNTFIDGYINNNYDHSEYEIINISKIEKVEIVSYDERDCDQLALLDKMSIKRAIPKEEERRPKRRKITLYFLLILMFIALGLVTYLYFFPEKFMTEYVQLECKKIAYNEEVDMKYNSYKVFRFNSAKIVRDVSVVDTYTFPNSVAYLEFKNNHKESEVFHVNGEYKYDDKYLTIELKYSEYAMVNNYDELTSYMKTEGYKCEDEKYYE